MDEDLELNRFVKSSLESRPPFVWKAPQASDARRRNADRRRVIGRIAWATASLLAASVVLVASFCLPNRAASPTVEDALRLLTEAEGVEVESGEATSPTDLLIAWQEAS